VKLAYVLNTYPQPSQTFIRRELRALERAGVQVQRIAMRRSAMPLVDAQDKEEEQATRYVLDAGAPRLALAMARVAVTKPGAFVRALVCAWRMGRRARSGPLRHLIYLAEACVVLRLCRGVDHVHAHFGTNATAVALLTRLLGGPGYSFTVHGPEEFDDPVGLSLDIKIAHAAFVVAISQFGRSQLFRWAGFDHWPKIKVVHCGIEPGAFAAPAPLPEGPPRLVSIGRFAEQKGQMILIEALAACRNSDIRLVLVGDGDMRPALERAITQHGLQGRVTLTGWLSEDGVRAELAAAHALVLPSFAEGLPMVIMEAMAAARPVLSTMIAGAPELVQQGQTGWLVPAGDVQALADAMDACAGTDHAPLVQMGQAGRDRVLGRHDIDDQAARLLALVQDAVPAEPR
jgi:glycosyltransferase involved in cell wall biosynthesis